MSKEIIELCKDIVPEAIEYAEGRMSALEACKKISKNWYFLWKSMERKGPHKKERIKTMAKKILVCTNNSYRNKCIHSIKSINRIEPCPKCGKKMIEDPEQGLRSIHLKIDQDLSTIDQHYSVHSYTKSMGISTCAGMHVKSFSIFSLDISDFFFSFDIDALESLFSKRYNNKKTARMLAMCCCIPDPRKNKHEERDLVMPIGITPAGMISNVIPYKMDERMNFLAKRHKLRYSRYSDNLYFSSETEHIPISVREEIMETIKDFTYAQKKLFKINPKKTRYKTKYRRQTILGTCTNEKLNIPRHRELKTKAALFALYKDAESLYKHLEGNSTGKTIRSIKGYKNKLRARAKTVTGHLCYMKAINPDKYHKYNPYLIASKFMINACTSTRVKSSGGEE